jgi:group I intron endonuclease
LACIYKITNLVNGKFYIGSTIRPVYKRKYEHFSELRKRTHYNKYLQNSFNKYKEINFKFEILEKVEFSKETPRLEIGKFIVNLESEYIKNLNPEYNIDRIIETTGKIGHTLSEETKNKIRESNRKRLESKPPSKLTLERRDREIRRKEGRLFCNKKIKKENELPRLSRKGWKHKPESIQKIKERSLKEDNRKRIREIQKISTLNRIGTHKSEEEKLKSMNSKFGKSRKIIIYNKEEVLINSCNFSPEAARITGVKRSNISNNLCGLSKSAGDYIFKYSN